MVRNVFERIEVLVIKFAIAHFTTKTPAKKWLRHSLASPTRHPFLERLS